MVRNGKDADQPFQQVLGAFKNSRISRENPGTAAVCFSLWRRRGSFYAQKSLAFFIATVSGGEQFRRVNTQIR